MLVCPNDMFPFVSLSPHSAPLWMANAPSAVTMRYDGLLGLCLRWPSWGGGQWRWLNDWGCLLTGGMCHRARSKRLLWTSLQKPRDICFVSFSFFSQSDSFGELGEYDLNVPWTALLGFWHFIEHATNYWHLKLSLQFSEFSTNVVPLHLLNHLVKWIGIYVPLCKGENWA